ncbi:NAD(P)H-dependent oxidoreductase [Algoriphagus winogradskyi]|uniref:Kef-type potassium/proton antiporter accessory protein, CPA2 family n=1 Tax=Algoriphagus winogradskyi TaxID=237017 RepID=A0ABY1N944_9BACT|nr:NAD(P)H-dependent oxidoreductase [Algoriphagus winogradskyi]SMP03343.1 Kef-type potassium/proton antiporter accessory protein, CPA2 family [Algoriphagus winogradskyi]
MRKVLVLFAHPKFEHSEVNQALIQAISGIENIEIRDLYELYPDFNISIQAEQEALFEAEVVIWHHPIYWYSCPPLMKQWIDLVLEFGWAYGPGGIYLKGKYIANAITSGGSQEAYQYDGRNKYKIEDFLRPFEQTARLCNMTYLPPFQVAGTHKISALDLKEKANSYREFLLELRDAADLSYLKNL